MQDDISLSSLNKIKFYGYTAVGLITTRVLLYLPTSVKTRLQVEQQQSVVSLVRKHGIRRLFAGVGTVSLGVVPSQWLYLTALELSKEKLRFDSALLSPLFGSGFAAIAASMITNATAGGVSSCVSAVIAVPLDVVSQRMQLGEGKLGTVVSNVWKSKGIAGFFQGYFASLIVYAPTSACWWMTYSNTRALLSSVFGLKEGALGIGMAGAIAGCTSAVITNPLDVLKTRKQTATVGNPSLVSLARQLYVAEGWRGFLRGAPARAVAMSANSFLMILSYEYVKKWSVKKE